MVKEKSSETRTGRDHRRDREDSHCVGWFWVLFLPTYPKEKRLTRNIKCILKSVLYKVGLAGRILQTCSAIRLLVRLCLRTVRDLCAIWWGREDKHQGSQKWVQACLVTTLHSRSFLTCCYKRRHTFFPYFLSPLSPKSHAKQAPAPLIYMPALPLYLLKKQKFRCLSPKTGW